MGRGLQWNWKDLKHRKENSLQRKTEEQTAKAEQLVYIGEIGFSCLFQEVL
jgi:hypothetical protein